MNINSLTATEREIIVHRLEVPDAIADVLGEEYDPGAVADAIDRLSAGADATSDVERAVLAECVAGSTYYAAAVSDETLSPQKLDAILRVGRALARKVGDYTGQAVRFPDY